MPRTEEEKAKTRRLIVVLEQASLETVKTSSGARYSDGRGGPGSGKEEKVQLLNADDHVRFALSFPSFAEKWISWI